MKRAPDPEIRKRQILETAMRLFYEKGFDETSLEDIAAELGVVKSLCYRYFSSKQALLDAALDEYTDECCVALLPVLHDGELSMAERLHRMMGLMLRPEGSGRYHDFFHKTGNEAMHQQLAARMCRYLIPHAALELERLGAECPEITAEFLLYGMTGIWQENGGADDAKAMQFDRLAAAVLAE